MKTQTVLILSGVASYLLGAATIGRIMAKDAWVTWRVGSFSSFLHGFFHFPISYWFGGIGHRNGTMPPPVAQYIDMWLCLVPLDEYRFTRARRKIYNRYILIVSTFWLPRLALNAVLMLFAVFMLGVSYVGTRAAGWKA